VVAKLKATDDSKIDLAATQILKTYKKEISVRERKIADINARKEEELIDLKEQLSELVAEKKDIAISIDIEAIGTNEARKAYVRTYTNALQNAIDRVTSKEEQIKEVESNVAKLIEKEEKEIALYKNLMSEMD
jgi:CRISPR/Cas system-associated endoribonuclease Cas2